MKILGRVQELKADPLRHLLLPYVVRRRHFQSAIILKAEQSMFRFPSGIVPSNKSGTDYEDFGACAGIES